MKGEIIRKQKTKTNSESAKKALLRAKIKDAKNRGYTFNLSTEQFLQLITSDCHYCGTPPSNVYQHGRSDFVKDASRFKYSGIDRVDSDIGYEPDNVVPCCATCNFAKRDLTVPEFLEWIERIHGKQFGGTK